LFAALIEPYTYKSADVLELPKVVFPDTFNVDPILVHPVASMFPCIVNPLVELLVPIIVVPRLVVPEALKFPGIEIPPINVVNPLWLIV
jgi:hypothetical protein